MNLNTKALMLLVFFSLDYRTHKTGKLLPNVKYSSKRSDFLRFYAYICHFIDDFYLS